MREGRNFSNSSKGRKNEKKIFREGRGVGKRKMRRGHEEGHATKNLTFPLPLFILSHHMPRYRPLFPSPSLSCFRLPFLTFSLCPLACILSQLPLLFTLSLTVLPAVVCYQLLITSLPPFAFSPHSRAFCAVLSLIVLLKVPQVIP